MSLHHGAGSSTTVTMHKVGALIMLCLTFPAWTLATALKFMRGLHVSHLHVTFPGSGSDVNPRCLTVEDAATNYSRWGCTRAFWKATGLLREHSLAMAQLEFQRGGEVAAAKRQRVCASQDVLIGPVNALVEHAHNTNATIAVNTIQPLRLWWRSCSGHAQPARSKGPYIGGSPHSSPPHCRSHLSFYPAAAAAPRAGEGRG